MLAHQMPTNFSFPLRCQGFTQQAKTEPMHEPMKSAFRDLTTIIAYSANRDHAFAICSRMSACSTIRSRLRVREEAARLRNASSLAEDLGSADGTAEAGLVRDLPQGERVPAAGPPAAAGPDRTGPAGADLPPSSRTPGCKPRNGNPDRDVTCGSRARRARGKFPVSVRPVLEGPGSHRRFLRLLSAGLLMASVWSARAHWDPVGPGGPAMAGGRSPARRPRGRRRRRRPAPPRCRS